MGTACEVVRIKILLDNGGVPVTPCFCLPLDDTCFGSGRTEHLATRIKAFALETDLFSLPELMATFDTIGEFEAEEEEWALYVERMVHYFAANYITEKFRCG